MLNVSKHAFHHILWHLIHQDLSSHDCGLNGTQSLRSSSPSSSINPVVAFLGGKGGPEESPFAWLIGFRDGGGCGGGGLVSFRSTEPLARDGGGGSTLLEVFVADGVPVRLGSGGGGAGERVDVLDC